MSDDVWAEAEEIACVGVERPHLVILGAGASLAAFPSGERNGKKLPVMRDFAEVLGLDALLGKSGIPGPYDDFEALFSDISQDEGKGLLRMELERLVYEYFADLELPDEPTLYDHLILSLREKDAIATFNWDPFLAQAASRNSEFAPIPDVLFLHGNVAFGYCPKCRTSYPLQHWCPAGHGELCKSPLLYPLKRKDYQVDEAIASHWRRFDFHLKRAWALTIFGYGAPRTDVEAVQRMKTAWGETHQRRLEETEILDIRDEEELASTWAPFIHSHHCTIQRSFYQSYIAQFPRRSGEALWAQLLDCKWLDPHVFPVNASFTELYDWLQPRIDVEREHARSQARLL